jgi:hypothetical protein
MKFSYKSKLPHPLWGEGVNNHAIPPKFDSDISVTLSSLMAGNGANRSLILTSRRSKAHSQGVFDEDLWRGLSAGGPLSLSQLLPDYSSWSTLWNCLLPEV